MEFFRRTAAQIKSQLAGLSTASRIAIGALLIIVCICVAWMANYAGQRQMVPLLNQSFTEDERARIIEKLDDQDYKLVGDRILVPQSKQRRLIAKLSLAEVLPKDTSAGFASLLEDNDIFMPQAAREVKELVVLQNELAAIISRYPNVAQAEVVISPSPQRRLMGVTPAATASVDVRTRSGEPISRKNAAAMAAFVSGTVQNLKRENVQVIVDGKIIAIPAEGQESASDYLELKAQTEQYLRNKILDALDGMNPRVQVDATPNMTHTQTSRRRFSEEESFVPKTLVTERTEESSTAQSSQEPGAMANIPARNTAAGGTTQSDTVEDGSASFSVFPGEMNTTEVTPPGGYSDITVAVSIPRAYFEEFTKQETGSQEKPSKTAVEAVTQRTLPEIKKRVMHVVGLVGSEGDDRVVVDTYWAGGLTSQTVGPDGMPLGTAGVVSGGFSAFAGSHAKEIGVSALALVSLFMVLMMVRKAHGPIDMTEEEAAAIMTMTGQPPVDALSVEDSNLVDEEGGAAVLAGMELDDDSVQSHQILQQIREMVQESPDVASNLVSKWIAQDE